MQFIIFVSILSFRRGWTAESLQLFGNVFTMQLTMLYDTWGSPIRGQIMEQLLEAPQLGRSPPHSLHTPLTIEENTRPPDISWKDTNVFGLLKTVPHSDLFWNSWSSANKWKVLLYRERCTRMMQTKPSKAKRRTKHSFLRLWHGYSYC